MSPSSSGDITTSGSASATKRPQLEIAAASPSASALQARLRRPSREVGKGAGRPPTSRSRGAETSPERATRPRSVGTWDAPTCAKAAETTTTCRVGSGIPA